MLSPETIWKGRDKTSLSAVRGCGGAGLAPAASTVMRLLSQMSMPSPVRQPSGQSQAPPRGRSSILCLGMKRKRAAARRSGPCHQPILPLFPLLPTLSSIGCRGRRRRSLCSLPRWPRSPSDVDDKASRHPQCFQTSLRALSCSMVTDHAEDARYCCAAAGRRTSMDHRCTDSSSPPSSRHVRAMAIAPSDECESMLFSALGAK